MKKLIYIFYAASFALVGVSCEQEVVNNSANPCPSDDPSIICPQAAPVLCPENASAGTASFTKFVAIGTSFTAGFQAGALFTEGQSSSLGKILATQFSCVGGGTFNQPSINSVNGFNLLLRPNPNGTAVLGRLRLQGSPPQPAPLSSGTVGMGTSDAIPNPQLNPGFVYTGSTGAVPVNQLNNFSVPAIYLAQALIPETGDWTLADTDPDTPGAQPHPYFSPFYARFASSPGTSVLLGDAISSLTNSGTFFLFWLGMDDVLLHAAYGGDQTTTPLTTFEDFKFYYNQAIGGILANQTLEGVIANYPDPFILPHFTSVPWNAIPLDAAKATALTTNLANNYNAFLDGMVAATVITAEEAALRKLTFSAGQNAILLKDESLKDLTPYMQGPYAALQPYALARQTKSTDIIPLSTAAVLGAEIAPDQFLGISVPVEDRYVITPQESSQIRERLGEFNGHIKSIAEGPASARLAFADVNTALTALATARAGVANGLTYTPNINPPTGIYSEDGLHPNSRGYAVIANVFIDAINAKFNASVPKVNLTQYPATGLPIP